MSKSLEQLFDSFLSARSQENVLSTFTEIKAQITDQSYNVSSSIKFYYELKKHIKSWRAQSIWKILDERVQHKIYDHNKPCAGKRFLVIGAGPIGLRMAVECSFLGAETHIIEKRTSVTRNNILHLWPFTIEDLRRLGAKKFYGQFCAGAIDHISTRQLQLILLKVCCLLGVNIHMGVEFVGLEEPQPPATRKDGWGITVTPHPPALPKWKWEVMVQATGRQHVLPLFQYKECRGQQAIGMTVNFVNRGTMEELTIEEISGIAFIYNQEFFNDMYAELGIALENIVYYKDETHYFVMSTKKHSLISKHVLKKDYPTTSELLSPDNIDYVKAQQFAREVAGFATNLPVLDFMTNHHGKADVAIFDFSAIKIAANSAIVVERQGHKLLMCLVGDSLMEPFWPQGTGCARGFLSVLNSAWMFKKYYSGVSVYEVLRERESLFNLLPQSSPMKLNSKYDKYSINPSTRYNAWHVSTEQFEVFHLYNKEDTPIQSHTPPPSEVSERSGSVRCKRKPRVDRRKTVQVTLNRSTSKEAAEMQMPPTPTLEQGLLLNWARESTCGYSGVRVSNLTTTWKSGLAFAALIHRYRPDILNFTAVANKKPEQLLGTVFATTSKELGIRSMSTPTELAYASIPDRQKIITYLTSLYNHFNSEESKRLQISPDMCYYCSRHITPDQLTSSHNIKFHSSCLKCEYCLDKIGLNTLHFVNDKIAKDFATRRKPEYAFLKSGFYCKFHFKEFFTAGSTSLYTEQQLLDKDTAVIQEPVSPASIDPLTTHAKLAKEIKSQDDIVILRENSYEVELKRAKSVSSVRNLRELFEHISTGIAEGPKDEDGPVVDDTRGHGIPKSKSFSGVLSKSMTPTTHPVDPTNKPISSKFSMNIDQLNYEDGPDSNRGKKKKSGIAKRIEKRRESVQNEKHAIIPTFSSKASIQLNSLTYSKSTSALSDPIQKSLLSVPIPHPPQHSPTESTQVTNKKKMKFKFFKKKTPNVDRTTCVVLENNDKPSCLDQTNSLILSNTSDPFYTIPRPEFVLGSDDDLNASGSFIRNTFARKTAPPKMKSPISSTNDDLVDSNLCRRPSKIAQDISREAVLLKTNSPEARTLLRSSIRNSKRGQSPLVKQNTTFRENSPRKELPSTPTTSRIQTVQATTSPMFEGVRPKTICSPVLPKKFHKVDTFLPPDIVKLHVCSPKLERSNRVNIGTPDRTVDIITREMCSPKLERATRIQLVNNAPQSRIRTLSLDSNDSFELIDIAKNHIYSPKIQRTILEHKPAYAVPQTKCINSTGSFEEVSRESSPESDTPPARPAPPKNWAPRSTVSDKTMTPVKSHPPDLLTLNDDVFESMTSPNRAQQPMIGIKSKTPYNGALEFVPKTTSKFKDLTENVKQTSAKNDFVSIAKLSTSSLLSSSSSSTFTTSASGMINSASFDSPGQVRSHLSEQPSTGTSMTNITDMPFERAKTDTKMPFLLRYEDADSSFASTSLEISESSSDFSEIRSEALTPLLNANPPKPFMYAKRSPVVPKPQVPVTPSPEPPMLYRRTPEAVRNMRYSSGSEECARSNNGISAHQKVDRSNPPDKPPRRSLGARPDDKISHLNRVLERNTTPADQASINQILQKYRKPHKPLGEEPKTSLDIQPNRHTSYQPSSRETERSVHENIDRRKSYSNNRVKMITQLSASFDKTIDKLINKYHKADTSVNSKRKSTSEIREPKSLNNHRNLSSPPTKIPSCTRDAAGSSPPTTSTSPPKQPEISRDDTSRASTRSRDIIPIDPRLLRYDRNSSFKDPNSEYDSPRKRRQDQPIPRLTSPSKPTELSPTKPDPPSDNTRAPQSSDNWPPKKQEEHPKKTNQVTTNCGNASPVVRYRHADRYTPTSPPNTRSSRLQRHQSQPTMRPPSDHHPVERSNTRGVIREEKKKSNLTYIDVDEKKIDKRDYNYLKSLYYQYSAPHNVASKVDNSITGISAFQRKQTDV